MRPKSLLLQTIMGQLTLFPHNYCILVQLGILATILSLVDAAQIFTVCRPSWVNSLYFHVILAFWSNPTFWPSFPSFSRCDPNLYCLQTIKGQLHLFPHNSWSLAQLDILVTIPSCSRCGPNLYCLQTIMGQLTLFPYSSCILVQPDVLATIPSSVNAAQIFTVYRPSWVNSPYFHIILAFWSNPTFWQLFPVFCRCSPNRYCFQTIMGQLTLFLYCSWILVQPDILATIPSSADPPLYCLQTIMGKLASFSYDSRIFVQLDILATIPSFSRCTSDLYCLQTIMGQLTLLDILTNILRFIRCGPSLFLFCHV